MSLDTEDRAPTVQKHFRHSFQTVLQSVSKIRHRCWLSDVAAAITNAGLRAKSETITGIGHQESVAVFLLALKHVNRSRSVVRSWLTAPLAKIRLLVRFAPMTARAYATLAGMIVAERLWVVEGPPVRSRGKELT